MKHLITAAAAAATLGFASAHAALVDFAGDADTNGERAVASVVINGVDMSFSAFRGMMAANAYLDENGGQGPAGLGVCLTLSAGQCDPSSDDNITDDERVTITFNNGPFDLSGFSFTTTDHNPVDPNATLGIGINGGAIVFDTFANFIAAAFINVTSITFAYGGAMASEFYVNSFTATNEIPVPGAIPLLLSGIAGLGFAARRKKAV